MLLRERATPYRAKICSCSSQGGLIAQPSQGAQRRQVTTAKPSEVQYPAGFLSDDRTFLIPFLSQYRNRRTNLDGLFGWNLTPRLFSSSSQVAFTPSDHLLFVRGDTLLAQAFPAKKRALL